MGQFANGVNGHPRASIKTPTVDELQRKVDQFNYAMPPGTAVILSLNGQEAIRTRVQTAATISGGRPVAWLEHAPGSFHIDNITKQSGAAS